MDISVIGSGYVGTTVAACFADLGHSVVNIEIDEDIVAQINEGESPIFEEGLPALLDAHAGANSTGRLRATTDYDAVLDTAVTFLALPTPQSADGEIDLSVMEDAAETLGETLAQKDAWHTVVVKSTVVPGSTAETIAPILENASGKPVGEELGIGMNPEFLREGTAVTDFLEPDKVVLGAEDDHTLSAMHDVFDPLIASADAAVVETDTRTAEMIKYANNAFLATKVSLINDLGNIAKEFGIDSYEVADAIGLDHRISEHFLRSGLGWGGSCFPKDIHAIMYAARNHDYDPPVLEAAVELNDRQPQRFLDLLDEKVDVAGKWVAVLGLSFKPGTDDIRNSRATPVIEGLQSRDAKVVAYDPVAMDAMADVFPDIAYADTAANALEDAEACLVCTGWDEFAVLDTEFDAMNRPIVVDGRRVIERREGLEYEGLTW